MLRPWNLISNWPLSAPTAAAARFPTRASPLNLGQAETDHQLSSCCTDFISVPATTIGDPLLVLATTYANGTAMPRPWSAASTLLNVLGGRACPGFATITIFAPYL